MTGDPRATSTRQAHVLVGFAGPSVPAPTVLKSSAPSPAPPLKGMASAHRSFGGAGELQLPLRHAAPLRYAMIVGIVKVAWKVFAHWMDGFIVKPRQLQCEAFQL